MIEAQLSQQAVAARFLYRNQLVAVIEQTPRLSKIFIAENDQPWVKNIDLKPYTPPEPKAPKARAARKLWRANQVVPADLLVYVSETYYRISAHTTEEQAARFEENWLNTTGQACPPDCYKVDAHPDRWGLTSLITFPTPPPAVALGDWSEHIKADPIVEGWSFICKNEFFWQVISVVKQTGLRISA